MAATFGTRSYFLSYLLETPLELPDSSKVKLREVWATTGETPRVLCVTVKLHGEVHCIPWEDLELHKIVSGKYTLRSTSEGSPFQSGTDDLIQIRKHILDRQIVDLDGAKVVRVNDVRLAHVRDGLFLVAVDISFAALLRRLGTELLARKMFPGKLLPSYIPWSEVQAFVPASGGAVRLASSADRLRTLHPSELADIIEDLDAATQAAILDALGEDSVAEVIEEMEPDAQVSILSRMGVAKAADVLEQMDADEVADIIDDLPAQQAEDILQEMEGEASAEVRELLEYGGNQVGSLMSKEYVSMSASATAGETLEALRRDRPEAKHALAVFGLDDKSRLSVVVPLTDLVMAEPNAPLWDLGMERLVWVRDDDPISEVVEILERYRSLVVPVLDADDELVGAVTIDDVLDDLLKAGGKRLRG
ncbi:MAG: magnesium transporter [Fibrobacteres bacterium]|nr:magnesium transporter [Fibrobacterota bacterium]